MEILKEIKLEISKGQKQYYVYVLYKPNGSPFYVGKGKSNRIACHENEARAYAKGKTWKGINTFKLNTINKIWKNGEVVYYQIDSWHDENEKAGLREIELVEQYGKKINNTGILTNIRDGGELLTEEDRKYLGEKLRQFYIDHPEMRERISDSVKAYIADNPEFVDNLMTAKNKWIEEHPEEYKAAQDKRREIGQLEDVRRRTSETLKEYFSDPDNLAAMSESMKKYYQEHPEAIERLRKQAIELNTCSNLERWRKEKPEEYKKHYNEKMCQSFNNWRSKDQEEYEGMVVKRNNKLRTDEHREKMRQRKEKYDKNNPDGANQRREKANEVLREKSKIWHECRILMNQRLVELGLDKIRESISHKVFGTWKRKGYFEYFPSMPTGTDSIEKLIEFKKELE